MRVSILGYSGFLGSNLVNHLKKKNIKIVKIDLRKFFFLKNDYRDKVLESIFKSNVIVNCASSLEPKNESDFFLNEFLPELIVKKNSKYQKKIIHISTINVLTKERKDLYSISKKIGENKIKNNQHVTIVRLPLIYKKNNKNEYIPSGNLKKLFKYLDFVNLPLYPMIYPGHKYKPINIVDLLIFLERIIFSKKINRVYNLQGKKEQCLWDIFYDISKQKKKTPFKIRINFNKKYMPNFIKTFLKKKNNFLQQLFSIDHKIKT